MEYKIITDVRDFEILENEWNLIFDRNNFSVFQSFIFNYYSWKEILIQSSLNSLFIIKIIQNNITIGFFPLYNDKTNTLRFINDVHSDFCDIILDKEIDLNNLLQFIFKDCEQKKIQLINLKENSILTQFSVNNYQYNLISYVSAKYTDFEVNKGLFPDNCAKLLCKERGEIRRIVKKNLNCKHYVLSKSHSSFPIDEILKLRQKMINNGSRSNKFLPIVMLKLIEKLYNYHYIEISCVKDSEVRAILFVMKNKNDSLFWIDLYDNIGYTSTLNNYISYIAVKSLENKICINLGRGAYKWKIAKFRPNIYELYTVNYFSSWFFRLSFLIKNHFISVITLIYRKFIK
jgi:hypothetical protein